MTDIKKIPFEMIQEIILNISDPLGILNFCNKTDKFTYLACKDKKITKHIAKVLKNINLNKINSLNNNKFNAINIIL